MTAILSFLRNFFPTSHHDRVLLVGGVVRDMLLGKEHQDIDLVTALTDGELRALGFRLVAATSAATIYFKHHPEFGAIEVTRIDSMADLEDDLRRRDFTINAMAMDFSGKVFDISGSVKDLRNGIIRACSERTFTGDPLRIFRAFRFEADGWRMTPETAELIWGGKGSDAPGSMPVERFSNEMMKALACKQPEQFFQRMIEFSVGAEFLPELFRMPGIPAGPYEHHPEGDLFTHSIQVLQRVAAATDDPLARFCALFHDIGKLATDPALYPKHHGHDFAGFAVAVAFCNRLNLCSTHRVALAWISSLHGRANLWDKLRDSTKITMAERAITAGITGILPLVAAADKAGGPPMGGWDDVVRIAGMNTRELGIDPVKLETIPVRNRSAFILHKRIELLREQRAPIRHAGK